MHTVHQVGDRFPLPCISDEEEDSLLRLRRFVGEGNRFIVECTAQELKEALPKWMQKAKLRGTSTKYLLLTNWGKVRKTVQVERVEAKAWLEEAPLALKCPTYSVLGEAQRALAQEGVRLSDEMHPPLDLTAYNHHYHAYVDFPNLTIWLYPPREA